MGQVGRIPRLRRKHIWWFRFFVFAMVVGYSPPWMVLLIFGLSVMLMVVFAFGILGLMSPMPKSKVLTGLAKRHLMIANMRNAQNRGE